jgi:hypothetical protein
MALCDLTSSRLLACKNNIGGVGRLFFLKFIEDAFTIHDATGVATAINPLVTSVFEYGIEGDGNNVVENFVSDRNTGTSVNTQTLTANLKKIDATTSAELNLLTYGTNIAVVKDRNGVFHVLGNEDGMDFTIAQNTGGAKTEMNGYILTGVATTGSLSPKIETALITQFLALVV